MAKERPFRINKGEELTKENLERIFGHYDEVIRTLQQAVDSLESRMDAVEADVADHETRIVGLGG